ncbi:hypothetical protein AB0M11_28635 [Streptomyces sp. NPDC051987]|uniref:hypothetical protein n=1 Tax=Streptomyces sp. NPDC051987 TaxID=3155808 RepID=UPI003429DCB0
MADTVGGGGNGSLQADIAAIRKYCSDVGEGRNGLAGQVTGLSGTDAAPLLGRQTPLFGEASQKGGFTEALTLHQVYLKRTEDLIATGDSSLYDLADYLGVLGTAAQTASDEYDQQVLSEYNAAKVIDDAVASTTLPSSLSSPGLGGS